MEWDELLFLVGKYIDNKRHLEKINNADIYGNYKFCYKKDLHKSVLLLEEWDKIKKDIKNQVWTWNYIIFLFNRNYFYKKLKLI